MRRLVILLLLVSAAPAAIFINSFNSGQLNKELKIRHDLDKTAMGSEILQNILVRPQGMAFKRPGTEYIDRRNADVNLPTTETVTVGGYPTLRTVASQADPGLTHTLAISNVTELQAMGDNLAGNYYLTGNIDASATSTWNGGLGFDPIGPDAFTPFTGTLDGDGYTITGITIARPLESYVGLFGYLGAASKVANMTLADVDITGLATVGGLVGYMYNAPGAGSTLLIQNCHTSGTVSLADASGANNVGGLIGWGYCAVDPIAEVYDCTSSCTVTNNFATGSYAGGLIGLTWGGVAGDEFTVGNCSATGDVTSLGSNNGGLIGAVHNAGSITDSYATGDVSGVDTNGGLIGDTETLCIISRCYATGDVTSSTHSAGGLVGVTPTTATIQDCYAWGDATSATQFAGGFMSATANSVNSITDNCYSIGTATSGSDVGGFNGYLGVNSIITNSYWDTEASGNATSDGGTGKTTAEMKTQSTYSGWDFTTVWQLPETEEEQETTIMLDLSGDTAIRLIPFEYAENDAYVLEFGHRYISFLRTVP